MDFSQVRAVTIPEGSVNRILSGATVLWEKTGGLPTEYQQVEYIESSGTQYIDLPFGFDDTDVIETRFSIDTSMSSDKYVNSPKTWNNNNNRFGMGVHSSSVDGYCVGFGSRATNNTFLSPRTRNDGEFHTWTYSNREFSISDLGCGLNVSNITFGGTTANLRLFYGYNAPTKCRIASYHHVKTGAEYNLVPCYRKADGEIGLYDLVTRQFFTNQGTGTFTKGPDASLPTEYQEVEYIENSGPQYIDTGIVGRSGTRFETRLSISQIKGGNPLAGCFGNNSRFYLLVQNANGNIGTSYTTTYYSSTPLAAGTPYDIGVDMYPSAQAIRVDGETVYTGTISGGINTGRNIYLFGYNYNGFDPRFPVYYKLYKAQFYYNDVLVGNFIPCYRKADGEIGLYDLVSATFFTNSGSGTFSKGADVT